MTQDARIVDGHLAKRVLEDGTEIFGYINGVQFNYVFNYETGGNKFTIQLSRDDPFNGIVLLDNS